MSSTRSYFPVLWILLLGLTMIGPAGATNHITRIDEVVIGAFGRSDIQAIVLSHSGCDQTMWGPQGGESDSRARLVFFDASNSQVGEFIIPSNPPCNSGSVLIATQAFADLVSTPAPDFIMPPLGVPGSGKVCFKDNPDGSEFRFPVSLCVTYGSFSGDTEQGSAGNADELPLQDICGLHRTVTGISTFGEPSFNDDFVRTAPEVENTAGATGGVEVPPQFGDVPASHGLFRFVEALFNAGVTSGCGGGNFCPSSLVTREQMAVFLLVSKEGEGFLPPPCTTPTFSDVPCSSPFARWIEELVDRGITSGCGGGKFCPKDPVTRAQMAVFLLVTDEGSGFLPPACTTPTFSDVPCSSPFARWIEELVDRGITSGCGGGKYCPGSSVTRGQMAVFLTATFGLPTPVLLADTVCEEAPTPACAHDLCVTGDALDPDCDPCVEQICNSDPFCCTGFWDSFCVGHVSSICGQSCS